MKFIKFVIVVWLVFVSSTVFAFDTKYDWEISRFTKQVFPEYPHLWLYFKAQMRWESNYNSRARSSHHAKGLMQLKSGTFMDMKNKYPSLISSGVWNTISNIRAGILYNYEVSRPYEHLNLRDFRRFMFASYLLGPNKVNRIRGDSFRFDNFLVNLKRQYPANYWSLVDYLHRIDGTYLDFLGWHKVPLYAKSPEYHFLSHR